MNGVCADCGADLDETDNYCGECGAQNRDACYYCKNELNGRTFDQYQELSKQTAQGYADADGMTAAHNPQMSALFLAVAINGEAGELAEKVKKHVREDDDEYLEEAEAEMGDILWYMAQLASLLDVSLGDVADENLGKLLDRQERDVITGQGDER